MFIGVLLVCCQCVTNVLLIHITGKRVLEGSRIHATHLLLLLLQAIGPVGGATIRWPVQGRRGGGWGGGEHRGLCAGKSRANHGFFYCILILIISVYLDVALLCPALT